MKFRFSAFVLIFSFFLPVFSQAQTLQPTLIKKLNPDFSSYPFGFTAFNGSIYFFASRSPIQSDNISLWKSDGTEVGTLLVKDSVGFLTTGDLPEIKAFNGQLIFLTRNSSTDSLYLQLWKSDGTENGTQVIRQKGRDFSSGDDLASGKLTLFNGKLYFNFYDATGGSEPFYTDGTTAGTQMLKDIQTSFQGMNTTPSYPHRFTVIGNALYFWAIPFVNGFGLKQTLFKSDGTTANTILVKEFEGNLSQTTVLSHLVEYEGKVYFSASTTGSGYELWSSDGTEAGTQKVKEINPGTTNSGDGVARLFDAKVFKGRLYFWAFDPASGHELWSTSGTAAGTTILKNTNASSIPSLNQQQYNSNPFFVFGGKMYYANNDGLKGREPWVTDGSVAGTKLFADVNSSGTAGSIGLWNPGYFIFQGSLYFRALNGNGVQICKADTLANTFTKFPVSSGFFTAELPFEYQLSNDERFAFHEINSQLCFPAGSTENGANPYSYEYFKLAPVTSVLSSESANFSILIFPNPVHEFLVVESKFPIHKIQIFNGMGQEQRVEIKQDKNLDVSHLVPGVYSLVVTTKSGIRVKQFLKE